jgi:tetratricopeptide (TPR) repeat protein
LLDKTGQPWQIEFPATLPPEVYLIACASYDGNLHALATHCLDRGAQTVVCGHGKLDARQMAAALSSFLDTGQSPCQILRALQAQDAARQPGGVHWLRYYGAVPLAPYDRLTLAFYQQSSRNNPFTKLSRQLEEEGAQAISDFLTTVANPANGFWPLTQYWLLPLAAYWAEKHDHALMQKLKTRLASPKPGAEALRPARAYGLASLYRRDGEYPKAVQQLADGLTAHPNTQQEIDLLGAMLNDLIDLNLPDAGQAVLDRLTQRLSEVDDQTQAFRLLDRRARLLLRQGRVEVALNDLRRKRLQCGGNQSIRELAGLLYAAAWFRHNNAEALASEALDVWAEAPTIGGGNDDHAYLLRALALWQWRCGGQADAVQVFLPECKKRLETLQDPGPFAAILIYDGLRRQDCAGAVWDEAIHALEHGRYWLELSAFHALAGQRQQAARTLQNFQRVRRSAITALQGWTLDGWDWQKIRAEREQQEHDLFLADDFEPEKMLCLGMLPL